MNKNKGFSLLEILVAFSILAISLGIVLKIFSSGVNTAIVAEEYTMATQIAESLMAKTGIETVLEEGSTSGVEADKYRWQVVMTQIPELIEDQGQSNDFVAVRVTVEWGEEKSSRVVELKSVKPGGNRE